jgi:hypothetical protein
VADGWELPMDDIQRLHLQLLESWPFWLWNQKKSPCIATWHQTQIVPTAEMSKLCLLVLNFMTIFVDPRAPARQSPSSVQVRYPQSAASIITCSKDGRYQVSFECKV